MIIEKEGYGAVVKNIMITSSNSQVYTCSGTILLSTEMANCEDAPEISGTVNPVLPPYKPRPVLCQKYIFLRDLSPLSVKCLQ